MVIKTINKKNSRAKKLREILDMHTDDVKLITKAVDILKSNGSIEYSAKKAKNIMENAWKKVEKELPDGQGKKNLEELAKFIIERKL